MTRWHPRLLGGVPKADLRTEEQPAVGLRSHGVVLALVGGMAALTVVGSWLTRSVEHDLIRHAPAWSAAGQTLSTHSQRMNGILVAVAASSVVMIATLIIHLVRRDARAGLAAARLARRTNSFEGNPVALWEEDYSEVGAWLQSLRDSGVTNLRKFLADRPDVLDHGIGLVRILALNPAARRMINSEATPFLFGSEPGTGHPQALRDSMVDQFEVIWSGEDHTEIEISGTRIDGSHLDVVLYWQAARAPSGEIDLSNVMVAMVDVTERAAAEVELVRMIKMRDQMIAAVSHELRTPLTSVIGFLGLLKESSTPEQGSEERALLEIAAAEAESLGFLVEDLLVAARKGLGKVPVKEVPTVIGEIVLETLEHLARSSVGEAGCDVEVPGDLEAVADPIRVRQILRNLIVNSIRYGGEHRRVVGATDGPEVVVQVIDDGPGVEPEKIGSLFEPYRNAQVESSMPGSLGLGLTISRTLAGAMGGDLSYHRRAEETVFELRLPAVPRPFLQLVDGAEDRWEATLPGAPWRELTEAAASGGWSAAYEPGDEAAEETVRALGGSAAAS